MNIGKLFAILSQAFVLFEGGLAELDAGQPAATPSEEVGSRNGKPLYAKLVFSETP